MRAYGLQALMHQSQRTRGHGGHGFPVVQRSQLGGDVLQMCAI